MENGDAADRRVMEFGEDQIDAAREIFVSEGGDGCGPAEEMNAEIDIVDQQVKHATAAFSGI
jgi:hypothetical protein